MDRRIDGKRIAILATDGFEQAELLGPRRILDEAGALTAVVSVKPGEIKGWNESDWGQSVPVDKTLDQCSPGDFDALVLPGGVINPDKLRMIPEAVAFVRGFFDAGKPIGAICHGPWLLVEANIVRGRTVTSWASLQTDLRNAGAHWVDQRVVTDQGIVTSRKPDDIPAFGQKLIEEIGEGVHAKRSGAELY
ncbi:type 1 glutamine amidotransferase domain-containing protein [Fimbriimonas ginsengisoli]|uniref:Intracellular protease, PfpI family n=1 Tax=Fimbriimonas ginsengisoli Gsoil 348 TaxID=661478 RepID=A0A068NYF1_FIMGI|nr:type 1 glutamine amidotransferase domain-containing protein [Fimbriimonas ginsengisoli]AIE88065.1 intracellular protease, PfpI family [Fimbriimonas ginsengisoli Gsoil 348]